MASSVRSRACFRAHLLRDAAIRRLTPLECERLMSWPDHWTQWGRDERGREIEMSDTQRYRMCGNGVVSDVVAAIVSHHILEHQSA